MSQQKKYLALGDSYTIGESVAMETNFPNQLMGSLTQTGIEVAAPKIIAVTGWTTTDLKTAILEENPSTDYDLVTLLIGVNNQYQQKPIELYSIEFRELLENAISFAGGKTKNIIVMSIPDYGITPFAKDSDIRKIATELDSYNQIAKTISEEMNVTFIDITNISRDTHYKEDLLAEDGLHPSVFQYSLWAKEILPFAKKILMP